MSIRLAVGLNHVDLPNPTLGDGDELNIKTRYLFTMSSEVHSYKYTPSARKWTLMFNAISIDNLADLVDFIQTYANVTVTFTDWLNQSYSVRIATPVSEFTTLLESDCSILDTQLELVAA
jgi:hypothetical protein